MSLTYFRPRGDVAANWKAANPVLKEREMVVEWESAIGVGQPRVKFGKAGGTTHYNDTDYAILPIKYRTDYNVWYKDGTMQAFDCKGNPDSLSLLKRKMVWAKYPEINLTFICRSLKFGGWVEWDELKRLRKEAKKAKK